MDAKSYAQLRDIVNSLEEFMDTYKPTDEIPSTPVRAKKEKKAPGAPARKKAKTEDVEETTSASSTANIEEAKNTDGVRRLNKLMKNSPIRKCLIEEFGLAEDDKKGIDKAREKVNKYMSSLSDEDYDKGDEFKFVKECAAKERGEVMEEKDILSLTIEELSKLTLTEDAEAGKGIYLDGKRRVTGPQRNAETEDLEERTIDDVTYLVDTATKRVYSADNEETFLGYSGFGTFKNL